MKLNCFFGIKNKGLQGNLRAFFYEYMFKMVYYKKKSKFGQKPPLKSIKSLKNILHSAAVPPKRLRLPLTSLKPFVSSFLIHSLFSLRSGSGTAARKWLNFLTEVCLYPILKAV